MEEKGNIGDVGSYDVTISEQGQVVAKVTVAKQVEAGAVKLSLNAEVDVDIFKLAEAIAAKTSTTWDDAAVKALEKLLGYTPAP